METIQVELISLSDITQLAWVTRIPPEWRSRIIADRTLGNCIYGWLL